MAFVEIADFLLHEVAGYEGGFQFQSAAYAAYQMPPVFDAEMAYYTILSNMDILSTMEMHAEQQGGSLTPER